MRAGKGAIDASSTNDDGDVAGSETGPPGEGAGLGGKGEGGEGEGEGEDDGRRFGDMKPLIKKSVPVGSLSGDELENVLGKGATFASVQRALLDEVSQ